MQNIPIPVSLLILGTTAMTGNPILPDFHADPSAHEWDGKYWIYPSHDIAGSAGWDMVDWHAFSSTDLVNWTDHGVIFSLKDVSWADRKAYAPDCAKRHGKFYFYFPADYQIGVAVSDSPTGPFEDALGRPLISRKEKSVEAMDPAVFVDDDGQGYLYYGGHSTAGVVKLKPDMVTRDGEIMPLSVKDFHEGGWMHKRNGLYYFSYCARPPSTIAYCTGTSPLGPFKYRGIIIDNRSRNNHHSIAEFGQQWYLFYHIQGPSPYERRVCAEYLHYNPDGTIKPIEMTRQGVVLKRAEP